MIKKFTTSLVVWSLFIVPVFVLAQAGTGNKPANPGTGNQSSQTTPISIDIKNPTNAGSNLMELLSAILQRIIMPIAAVAVVVYIIWAGFNFLLANGNPKKIEEAKSRLLWALIGGGILLGAVGIAEVLKNTIGQFMVK